METFEFSKPEEIRDKFYGVRNEQIQTSSSFIFISWIILLVSLPVTVAGYIGCFTLVSGSRRNGPLFWLLLEAGLPIIQILLWTWNPGFDERTVTTEKVLEVIKQTGENTRALILGRHFLEWIT